MGAPQGVTSGFSCELIRARPNDRTAPPGVAGGAVRVHVQGRHGEDTGPARAQSADARERISPRKNAGRLIACQIMMTTPVSSTTMPRMNTRPTPPMFEPLP